MDIRSLHAQVVDIDYELEDLKRKVTSSPDRDYSASIQIITASLKDVKDTLGRSTISASHQLKRSVKQLTSRLADLSSLEKKQAPTASSTVDPLITKLPKEVTKLPQLSLPIFHGNVMKWGEFCEAAVHKNDQLNDQEKLTYLKKAVKDPEASPLLNINPHQYNELVALLQECYNKKRVIHQHYVLSIVNAPAVKSNSHQELLALKDSLTHSLTCLDESGQPEAEYIWTSLITSNFNKTLKDTGSSIQKRKTGTISQYNIVRILER